MNIYLVNRYSKFKGPFDIIGFNREHIIRVGDICLRDYVEGVAFLVVCSSKNSWNACKRVGIGNNEVLNGQGNTLLFSFDGLHKRKGNVFLIKQLSDCFREKVIVDFFTNAIDILEYKKDLWDVSLFSRFFASSQDLITRPETIKSSVIPNSRRYPSVFAKYLDDELLELLTASLNEGNGLKEAYMILRDKDPMLFRAALMKFLAENPKRTIFDKPAVAETPTKPKVETVPETPAPPLEETPYETVANDEEDQSFLLNAFNSREFRELLNRYHKGDKRAFEQLVKANLKLVTGLARKYKDHGVEYDDLVQEGAIGLIRAIERYNPNRKVPFFAYAKWWIHQAFNKALIDMQSIVKIPANQVSLYKKVRKSIERYEQEHGYEPSSSEIDIEEDLAPENIEFLSNLPDRLHELTTKFNDWDELPGSDSADDLLMKESQTQFINSILAKLKHREADILRKAYGIGQKSESLSEIGKRMGLTRERVRQIAEKAVIKLRKLLTLRKATYDKEEFPELGKTDVESTPKPKEARTEPKEKVTPAKESSPKENNREKSKYSQTFSSSTSLHELVGLRIITRKQLKHCHKRNLRTIGDVEQIIKRYHLTPDSTRFTQYTIDMWFSIVGLLTPKDVTKAKAKRAEDDIEYVYVDIPTAAPYIEVEVPLRDIRTEGNKSIDAKKLDTIFDNKSTSYKYFWFMAIISLAKESQQLSLTYKDILIRMVALAWPIVLRHKINLGKKDMLCRYLSEIANKTSLDSRSTGKYVEFYLGKHYMDAEINRTLSPLLNNVPYRFLSPWIKFSSNKDVSERSRTVAFDGPYALYTDGIVLNSMWWHHINAHYREICNSSISSFNQFVQQNNSRELAKRTKYIDWNLLKQQ